MQRHKGSADKGVLIQQEAALLEPLEDKVEHFSEESTKN